MQQRTLKKQVEECRKQIRRLEDNAPSASEQKPHRPKIIKKIHAIKTSFWLVEAPTKFYKNNIQQMPLDFEQEVLLRCYDIRSQSETLVENLEPTQK